MKTHEIQLDSLAERMDMAIAKNARVLSRVDFEPRSPRYQRAMRYFDGEP